MEDKEGKEKKKKKQFYYGHSLDMGYMDEFFPFFLVKNFENQLTDHVSF